MSSTSSWSARTSLIRRDTPVVQHVQFSSSESPLPAHRSVADQHRADDEARPPVAQQAGETTQVLFSPPHKPPNYCRYESPGCADVPPVVPCHARSSASICASRWTTSSKLHWQPLKLQSPLGGLFAHAAPESAGVLRVVNTFRLFFSLKRAFIWVCRFRCIRQSL